MIPGSQPGTHGVSLNPIPWRLPQVPASQLPMGRQETCQSISAHHTSLIGEYLLDPLHNVAGHQQSSSALPDLY